MGKKSKGKLPRRIQRASEANEAVEHVLADAAQVATEMRTIPGFNENTARLRRGLRPVWPSELLAVTSVDDVIRIGDIAARTAVVDLWKRQGRVAYDVHPEMAASLYRSDMKGKLPGNLFERLPHINPMIPLPRPWPYKISRTERGLIRAFFVTGVTGSGFCSSTDPQAEGIALMPWINLYDEESGEYNFTVTPVLPLPSSDKPFTLDDVVTHVNSWHGTVIDEGDRRLMKQIIPGALSLLAYMCCDNRDVQEPPPAAPKGKRRSAPPRDPFYVRVGWYVGPKLHAARMRAVGRIRDGVSTPSGVEQGPQHRVGHYKVIHFGPAKSTWKLDWVKPYWTKLDMLDEGDDPVTQVVPVDAQTRDPAGHRDVKLANLGTEKSKEIRDRERQREREEDWDW